MSHVEIYTDGGARPNPGPGGWGVVILEDGKDPRELSGGDPATTNNRMELQAAIAALEDASQSSSIDLYTDSRYVRQGITSWLAKWQANGWKRGRENREEVKNADLWKRLAVLDASRNVTWHWVKGHAGHQWNERADELATAEIERLGVPTGNGEPESPGAREATDVDVYIRVRSSSGQGNWGLLVISDEGQEFVASPRQEGSANRLELLATLEALQLTSDQEAVGIHVGDYARRGATEWMTGWKRRGWQTGGGDPVKNVDLWRRLERVLGERTVSWTKIDNGSAIAKELAKRLKTS